MISKVVSRFLFEIGELAFHWGYWDTYQLLMSKSSDLDKDNVIWSAVDSI